MFELPRYVLKGGRVVVEQGEVREEMFGRTLHVVPGYDEGALADIKKWFESYYTIQFANYPVDEHYMAHGGTAVPVTK
jgi:formylmethanofuran dehydrogenase subunit A